MPYESYFVRTTYLNEWSEVLVAAFIVHETCIATFNQNLYDLDDSWILLLTSLLSFAVRGPKLQRTEWNYIAWKPASKTTRAGPDWKSQISLGSQNPRAAEVSYLTEWGGGRATPVTRVWQNHNTQKCKSLQRVWLPVVSGSDSNRLCG